MSSPNISASINSDLFVCLMTGNARGSRMIEARAKRKITNKAGLMSRTAACIRGNVTPQQAVITNRATVDCVVRVIVYVLNIPNVCSADDR